MNTVHFHIVVCNSFGGYFVLTGMLCYKGITIFKSLYKFLYYFTYPLHIRFDTHSIFVSAEIFIFYFYELNIFSVYHFKTVVVYQHSIPYMNTEFLQ